MNKRVLLLITLLSLACHGERIPTWLSSVVMDAPPTPAVTVDVLCDSGGGSSGCSEASLRAVLTSIVPTLGPGSVIRLQGMADHVADDRQLATYTITAPVKQTRRAITSHQRQQTEELVTQFLTAASPVFANPDRRASPIAQSIARCVLAGSPSGGVHRIIILTDGRQVSKDDGLGHLDFECAHLPSADHFTTALAHFFGPDDLKSVVIHFANVQLEPVANDRCPASVERYAAIRDLWTASLTRLGAHVTWSMAPINSLN